MGQPYSERALVSPHPMPQSEKFRQMENFLVGKIGTSTHELLFPKQKLPREPVNAHKFDTHFLPFGLPTRLYN